jgi:uncharacterized protein
LVDSFQALAPQIQGLFELMGSQASDYQKSSGLTCLSGCGKCCLNPDVSATPMEMLPMALSLVSQSDFNADEWFKKLDSAPRHCLFYEYDLNDPARGACSQYETRPSICRLFGAIAVDDKDGAPRLSVCKLIKEKRTKEFSEADAGLAPRMSEWARKLYALHPGLDGPRLPINLAFRSMLERLLLLLAYSQSQE